MGVALTASIPPIAAMPKSASASKGSSSSSVSMTLVIAFVALAIVLETQFDLFGKNNDKESGTHPLDEDGDGIVEDHEIDNNFFARRKIPLICIALVLTGVIGYLWHKTQEAQAQAEKRGDMAIKMGMAPLGATTVTKAAGADKTMQLLWRGQAKAVFKAADEAGDKNGNLSVDEITAFLEAKGNEAEKEVCGPHIVAAMKKDGKAIEMSEDH